MENEIRVIQLTPAQLQEMITKAVAEAEPTVIQEKEEILDVNTAAKLLMVSTRTIHTLMESGKIRFSRVGPKLIRFKRSTLMEDFDKMNRNKKKRRSY